VRRRRLLGGLRWVQWWWLLGLPVIHWRQRRCLWQGRRDRLDATHVDARASIFDEEFDHAVVERAQD
jgi:hypothetical protein